MEDLELIYDEFKSANQKSLEHLEHEMQKIRAGKATPSLLQSVMVEYYGTPTPIAQVANVNSIDARTLTVQPWERNILNDVAKAIINSNLGFAPQNNGEMLIINIPPLTEERRKEMVKKAKAEGEHAKVGIRNNRKDALDMTKSLKNDGVSEDVIKDAEEEIQQITNRYIRQVDELVEAKEKDVMTI